MIMKYVYYFQLANDILDYSTNKVKEEMHAQPNNLPKKNISFLSFS